MSYWIMKNYLFCVFCFIHTFYHSLIAFSLWHSHCGILKDILNMFTQIILKVNWLKCSASDRNVSTFHPEGKTTRPCWAFPCQTGWLLALKERKRGCVLLKPHLQHSQLQGVLLRDQSPEQLCQPRSERTSSPRLSECPRLNNTWSKLSRRGEGTVSAICAIPKCRLFMSAFSKHSGDPAAQRFEIHSLGRFMSPFHREVLFCWRRYYMTYLSSHSYWCSSDWVQIWFW